MPQATLLNRYQIYFPNSTEFHSLKREIFGQHQYYLDEDFITNLKPIIIDAGAHIGLSTLYFKHTWPHARVIAIEPNPKVLPFLKQNITVNQLTNVEIQPFALAKSTGTTNIFVDNQDDWDSTASGWPRSWTNQGEEGKKITVPTKPLTDFLTQPIDLLKMDIEGAEQDVLLSCQDKIRLVSNILCEFHGREGLSLPKIIRFLTQHGFEVEVTQNGKAIDPDKVKGLALILATLPPKK